MTGDSDDIGRPDTVTSNGDRCRRAHKLGAEGSTAPGTLHPGINADWLEPKLTLRPPAHMHTRLVRAGARTARPPALRRREQGAGQRGPPPVCLVRGHAGSPRPNESCPRLSLSAVERGGMGARPLPRIEGLDIPHRLVVKGEVEDLEVLVDSLRPRGLRDHDVAELQMPAQDDLGGRSCGSSRLAL